MVNRAVIASLAAGVLCFGILLLTSPDMPMGWDEGNAIHRAAGIESWVRRFAQTWREPFSSEAIESDWRYTTRVEGHPAFYGIVIGLGRYIAGGWLSPLQAARFGPIALFSFAAGAATFRLWRIVSPAAAITGLVALVTLPRLFAHAHFASFDGPLTSCWLLAWAWFAPALHRTIWSLLWGVALGATMSCKFTGWLAPVPFIVWVAAFGDRRAARSLALGLSMAVVTFLAFNPPLWHEPLRGFITFLDLNLGRGALPQLNIPTTYFGQRYDARTPMPWHNTLVWTAITMPVGTLAMFLIGLGRAIAAGRLHQDWSLLIFNWAVLVIARATPWAPPHDAERLFLPSFAFLALIAGIGGGALWTARTSGRLRWCARTVVALSLLGSAASAAWYWPQCLSYYNVLIGGLRGAYKCGMEPTYYWDGLDAEVRSWLARNTSAGEKVLFGSPSWENLELMREWKLLDAPCLPNEPGEPRWYVTQNRPSKHSTVDKLLLQHCQPAFRKMIRTAPRAWGPWNLDVPIVDVYDYSDYRRWQLADPATPNSS